MEDYSYLGSGKISLRVKGAAAALLEVGNCSALSFNVTEDVKELKDSTQPGGGTYNEVRRISAVEMQLTAHDLSPSNLALALYGASTEVSGSTVSDEALGAGYKGGLLLFAKLPASTPAPVIEATNGDGATSRANSSVVSLDAYIQPATPNGYYYKVTTAGTTDSAPPTFPTTPGATVTDGTAELTCMGRIILTAGTDYNVTAGGIRLTDTAAFTDGEPLKAGYTSKAADVVEALTSSGQEYELVFEGLNEARSGKAAIIRVHRVKIGAAQQISLIGEEYAALQLTGKLLKDSAITTAGLSQYFKATIEQ